MTKARDVLGSLLPASCDSYVGPALFFQRLSESDDDGGAVPAVISFVVPLT